MRRGGILAALLLAGCVKTAPTTSSASTLDKYFGGPADTVTSSSAWWAANSAGIDFSPTVASFTTTPNSQSDLTYDAGLSQLRTPNKPDGIRYVGSGTSSTAYPDVAGAYTSTAAVAVNGVYGVKTVEGNYVQFRVRTFSSTRVDFDFSYQANGGTVFK